MERIAELRGEKEALDDALASIGAQHQETEDEELTGQLARIPDLSKALAGAPAAVKRQVFAAFDLGISYDKAERRVELTATVSEAVADAFENAKALQVEGSSVVVRDIAGPDSVLATTHGSLSESASEADFCFSRKAEVSAYSSRPVA